ncbi:MAG: phospho-sugar mutase, partial [Myxococcota bacterium]
VRGIEQARRWIADDPDPETRALAEQMLARADPTELEDAFGQRLAFGTAGIRGALGPGPGRMNRALVRRVTAGLAQWVARTGSGGGPVVVGCDARRGSAAFADDAARVLAGAGLPVVRFPGVCPTPLVAYAVRALGGRAGVMVTASHNPPGDNGYKVYGPSGGQIVPPADAEISAAIDAVGPTLAIPLGDRVDEVPSGLVDAYLREVAALRVHRPGRTVRIVYTPLHGVGGELALRVLAAAGHTDVVVVPEQFEPDGAFPTVAFPNPEEKGALDLALALAERVDADLILANDPDADRIAVAVRGRRLSGNEVGTLLAEDLLSEGSASERRLVATTVVSSTLLGRIAAAHGADYAETWTGFKWIAHAAESSPARFVLGYEEALGVCVGSVVRDKDGLSAALLVADLAAHLASRGETLLDALDALYRRYGVHLGSQVTVTAPGAAGLRRIAETMASVRARPWTELGGVRVTGFVDHAVPTSSGRPPADVLAFTLGADRVLLRPSGTEPKLKVYLEVVEPVVTGLDAAREVARERLGRLEAAVRDIG